MFQRLVDERRLEPAQEDDFYRFVLTLHQLNFLVLPMADGTQLYNRYVQRQRAAQAAADRVALPAGTVGEPGCVSGTHGRLCQAVVHASRLLVRGW